MKRKQRKPTSARGKQARAIDADRLIRVRGGDAGLGIAVAVAGASADIVTQQHNETLIEL
jgi:hypothetical protein